MPQAHLPSFNAFHTCFCYYDQCVISRMMILKAREICFDSKICKVNYKDVSQLICLIYDKTEIGL